MGSVNIPATYNIDSNMPASKPSPKGTCLPGAINSYPNSIRNRSLGNNSWHPECPAVDEGAIKADGL